MLTGLLTPAHVTLLLIVLLLVLGPKRIPEAGRAVGHGLREFKEAITGTRDRASDAELGPPEA